MQLCILSILSMLLAVLMSVHGAVDAASQTFTNTDLERYNADTNGVIIPDKTPSAPAAAKKEKRVSKKTEEQSKKFWCARGSARRAKVDKTRAKVEDAERELAEADPGPASKKKHSSAEKKVHAGKRVRAAKKELYLAEQSLNDLEQQAHSQNIPPGWLRCQFTY
jgi:hypothetical protein